MAARARDVPRRCPATRCPGAASLAGMGRISDSIYIKAGRALGRIRTDRRDRPGPAAARNIADRNDRPVPDSSNGSSAGSQAGPRTGGPRDRLRVLGTAPMGIAVGRRRFRTTGDRPALLPHGKRPSGELRGSPDSELDAPRSAASSEPAKALRVGGTGRFGPSGSRATIGAGRPRPNLEEAPAVAPSGRQGPRARVHGTRRRTPFHRR